MKILNLLLPLCLFTSIVCAQSSVTVTVNTQSPGRLIPEDFTGVSIFTETQKAGHRGASGCLFSASNTQLITLFKNSGIHHLRLGATGAHTDSENLDPADIDSLFAFAKAADIRVIYSLHWLNGVATAKYIWEHDRPYLDCFAYDNEPDNRAEGGSGSEVDNFTRYLDGWNDFAHSIIAVAPGAKFTGPDAAGRSLAPHFAKNEKDAGIISFITQHIYVGGNPKKHNLTSPEQAIDLMLSSDWDTDKYPSLERQVMLPVMKDGFSVRLTESDDYTHGVANASNAFAAALWALDYLHWWALHDARGVNFQNTEWLTTDTFHPDSNGNYQINPKAYGLRAFDLGSHGRVEPVTIDNADKLNLTAYAVGGANNLFVTIINKEHGAGARATTVTIDSKDFSSGHIETMFLTAPNSDVEATNGVTLGGAVITNNSRWQGQWTALAPTANSQCVVTVPSASAVIVKLSAK